jgi:hypothetical protein
VPLVLLCTVHVSLDDIIVTSSSRRHCVHSRQKLSGMKSSINCINIQYHQRVLAGLGQLQQR